MSRVILECPHEAFHAIHVAVEGARKGSKVVKVEKDALAALLRDHSKLIRVHRSELGGVL